jgi:hypothetical protein
MEETPEENLDLSVEYANNVLLEATTWDLKVLFGEYTNRARKVEWHTSMTMPWATAKLLAYFLQVNIAIYETYEQKIKIPVAAIPPLPAPPTAGQDDAAANALFEKVRLLHEQFIQSLR